MEVLKITNTILILRSIGGKNQMEELLQTIIRTAISYILLLATTYLLGKRMTTHLNYHSFAISITIGSIIANMGFETDLNFWAMIASLVTLALFFSLTSRISFKNVNSRKYLAGEPLVIIENGIINHFHMSTAKYTIDDLQQQLREQGTFKIEEIETAILEVSGKLSIQPKEQYKPVIKQDLNQLYKKEAIELIIDGKIMVGNLNSIHNQDWIIKQCQAQNVKVEHVNYAVVGSNDKFYLIR